MIGALQKSVRDAMEDITTLLLRLPEPQCSPCKDAAAEIEMLRQQWREMSSAMMELRRENLHLKQDCLTSDEREAVDIACMNLAETVRRGQKKQDEYMQEGDLEGAKWTEKGVVSLVQARATLRSLLERTK